MVKPSRRQGSGVSRLQAGGMPQPNTSDQGIVCYWMIPRLRLWGGVVFFLKKLGISLHLLIDHRSNAQGRNVVGWERVKNDVWKVRQCRGGVGGVGE